MWKFLNESVEGTSHRLNGNVCQDASFVTPFHFETDAGVILACSDGAGSAKESEIGSKLACDAAVHSVMQFLQSGRTVSEVDAVIFHQWMREVHDALNAEAERRGTPPRELACTLLMGVVGRDAAAFAQIGDGAIVIFDGTIYRPVFWPQSGEYQNLTFFLTDPKFDRNIQCEMFRQSIPEVALFSDGLQMLALKYDTKTVHQPFFTPLFSALRKSGDPQELINPMRQFLDSKGVNERTDDDKTLILATSLTEQVAESNRGSADPEESQAAQTTTDHVDETV